MMSFLKSVLISLIVLPAGLLAGETGGTNEAANDVSANMATHSWSIHGGPVEWQAGEPGQVIGHFEIRAPADGTSADAELLQAGACLVADLTPFGIGSATCTTQADCNQPGTFGSPENAGIEQYHGYCATRDGSKEATRCWTRPGPPDAYCIRTKDSWKATAGMHTVGPANGKPLGDQAPAAEWAVYACLAHPGHGRACGEPDNPHRQISLTPGPIENN